jgi:hypothetical protein
MESRSQAGHLANESRGPASTAPGRSVPWILRNEKFVRAMCMVGIYVFGAIFLVSILVVGVFTLISMALASLFLVSLAIFLSVWMRSRLRR